jgi:hypothetical protein
MDFTDELLRVDLGDQRRNDRLRSLVNDLTHQLSASLPQATGPDANLTYRFLDNSLVRPDDIRAGHYLDTLARIDPQQTVLLPSDTTFLDFSHHPATAGLGYLQFPNQLGLCLHSTLAVNTAGTPLGLVQQYGWRRDPNEYGKRHQRRHKDTSAKESQRWLDALQQCQQRLPPTQKAVFLADREADFYDFFAAPRRAGFDVLIRAKSRRRLVGEDRLLGQAVRAAPVQGTIQVRLPRQPGQPEREATLAVRYLRCQIRPPSTHPRRRELAPLPLTVVEVVEQDPPPGVKPAHWLLLTNRAVNSLVEAEELVRWYTFRWRGERYHFTLKDGCRVEDLQLETAQRLERAVAVYSIVAMRVLRLTYLAREQPEASCTQELSAVEQKVLQQATAKAGETAEASGGLSLAEAVRRLARLGGYQGRGRSIPGVKTLWRGLRRLHDLVQGYQLAQQHVHLLGNEQRSDE